MDADQQQLIFGRERRNIMPVEAHSNLPLEELVYIQWPRVIAERSLTVKLHQQFRVAARKNVFAGKFAGPNRRQRHSGLVSKRDHRLCTLPNIAAARYQIEVAVLSGSRIAVAPHGKRGALGRQYLDVMSGEVIYQPE